MLLMQILTVDKFRRVAVVVGYALLNVFVESGSNRCPETDLNALQVRIGVGHVRCSRDSRVLYS